MTKSAAELNIQIDTIIADMYKAFSKYKVNVIQGVYTEYGIYQSTATAIINDPIESLSERVVFDYLNESGDNPDALLLEIKHLLPRIVELFTQNARISIGTEVIFDKLYLENHENWSTSEITLIKDFATAHFKRTTIEGISQQIDNPLLDELIVMWDLAGCDRSFILSLLDIWQQQASQPKALEDYTKMIVIWIEDDKYTNDFASDNLQTLVGQWALSEEVVQAFKHAVYDVVAEADNLTFQQSYEYDLILQLKD